MRNTLIVALVGALALVPTTAAAQSACTVTTENLVKIPLPSEYGGAVVKLRAGPVLGAGRNDIVALTDTARLVLVRDGFATDSVLLLAEDVLDFTIAQVDGARAEVVAIGPSGLAVGAYFDSGTGDVGPTIKFSGPLAGNDWRYATMVDAASQHGVLQIVAAHGNTLLRATYKPETLQFTESTPAPVAAPIQFLAVGDIYPDVGVEVAVGSSSILYFYKGLTSATITAAANPLTPIQSASFIDVQRIPKGADVRDSIGVVQRHPATDLFLEVTSAPLTSAPIASGGLRHVAIAYSPIGLAPNCTANCTPTDLVFVAATGETLVFQGDPQVVGGMQFSYDPAQLSALNLAALVGEGAPIGLSATAGDLDGDGDGDLAYAAAFDYGEVQLAQFVLVRNDCGAVNTNELVDVFCAEAEFDGGSGTGSTFLGLSLGLSVPTPPSFPSAPNRARVTIYVREYSDDPLATNPAISPFVLYTAKHDVTPAVPPEDRGTLNLQIPSLALPAPWQIPASMNPPPLDSDSVLLYVQITPVLEQPGGLDWNGPVSNFVGATNAALLNALCGELPLDDYYWDAYCESDLLRFDCGGTDGAPMINELHRRRRLRPIGTPPQ